MTDRNFGVLATRLCIVVFVLFQALSLHKVHVCDAPIEVPDVPTASQREERTFEETQPLSSLRGEAVVNDREEVESPITLTPIESEDTKQVINESRGPRSPYAYAFLMGGCNPENGKYRVYIYSILVAAYILQESGSKADVVVMVQMSPDSSATVLPPEDQRLFDMLGIRTHYIPKIQEQNFVSTVLEKFRILELTEYRRVLFMDGDVMPFCNLDYLFELSDGPNAILKENVVLAWLGEPSNAGFFMLKPGVNEFDEIKKIISRRAHEAVHMKHPYFNKTIGWGHEIEEPGYKMLNNKKGGTAWNWYGVVGGQGLLYYWPKYHKKSVSLLTGNDVENWSSHANGTLYKESYLKNQLKQYSCLGKKHDWEGYSKNTKPNRGKVPYRDFVHFMGGLEKPWYGTATPDIKRKEDAKDSIQYWFHVFRILNRKLDMGIDVDGWDLQRTSKGHRPTPEDMYKAFKSIVDQEKQVTKPQ